MVTIQRISILPERESVDSEARRGQQQRVGHQSVRRHQCHRAVDAAGRLAQVGRAEVHRETTAHQGTQVRHQDLRLAHQSARQFEGLILQVRLY